MTSMEVQGPSVAQEGVGGDVPVVPSCRGVISTVSASAIVHWDKLHEADGVEGNGSLRIARLF
jgi:hypothetical protein